MYLLKNKGWQIYAGGLLALLVLDAVIIYGLTRVKVQDDNGPVQNLNDVFVNMITVAIILAIVGSVYVVAGTAYLAKNNKSGAELTVPFASALVLLLAIVMVAKVFDK
jgi:hypothetical protein